MAGRFIIKHGNGYAIIIDKVAKVVFVESAEGDLFSVVAGVLPRSVEITEELVERIVEAVRFGGAGEAAKLVERLGGRAVEAAV